MGFPCTFVGFPFAFVFVAVGVSDFAVTFAQPVAPFADIHVPVFERGLCFPFWFAVYELAPVAHDFPSGGVGLGDECVFGGCGIGFWRLVCVGLFFLGALFSYFVIIPAGFEWLIGESLTIGQIAPNLEDYINIELLLMIGFGVAFELPLIVFYLAVFHIVPYASFRAAWRYIYVIMLVVSASITPDASPVTLIFMYAAMLSLYEIALAITRFVIVAREGKKGLTESRLSFLSDDDDD